MEYTSKDYKKSVMITGGAGFIGSHFVKRLATNHPDWYIHVVDSLTYAGSLDNLKDCLEMDNVEFHRIDIQDKYISELFDPEFDEHPVTDIIHLAAESHVDNSIKNPLLFAETNVIGTLNLLDIALFYWRGDIENHRFHHVSTDEVYGALQKGDPKFSETNKYFPHSPYSASKAASDHFVRAYHDTYGLQTTISNCSNNYGPHQHEEKLIPLTIKRLVNHKPIPIYGTGDNIRDWLYVEDHCSAIEKIFLEGKAGETYNVGDNCELSNINIVRLLISEYAEQTGENMNELMKLITFVKDRAGHDFRYAIDSAKIRNELGWKAETDFNEGLANTVKWYREKFSK